MTDLIETPPGPHIPRRGNRFTQWVGLICLYLSGWRITGTFPDEPKAIVVVAPHTSNLDGFVAAAAILALRLKIGSMAKSELFTGPLGGFMRWLGVIPIDRSNPQNVVPQSVNYYQQHEQLWVGIAPEGTRHGASEWKSGFYRIAQQADIPMVLVALDYGRKQVRVLGSLKASDDAERDMQQIIASFRGIRPHHPERLSKPLADADQAAP